LLTPLRGFADIVTDSKVTRRPYRQTARAQAAAATREHILDALFELLFASDLEEITLEEVAARARVTPQTVLRRFGSKSGLVAAALAERADRIMVPRRPVGTGPRAAVAALVASYEEMGDASWRMLRAEQREPGFKALLAGARALHRAWIEASFASALPRVGRARQRKIDALFTALDFYVWKLHRRDLGRGRRETEELMLHLVEAILRAR
jgi:AcrR family transcriptional regulator